MEARLALDPDEIFASLRNRRGLILAVSGGPDSTALMALAAGWGSRPPVLVVTVDHGLRPLSADEARLAAANAAKLGLPCRIVRAELAAKRGNRQAAARAARYRCLAAAAREAGFDTIVTAHHQDDQAETFLLRLARGSGVYGLAAMAPETFVEGISLVRPFLAVPRSELARIAEESGLPLVHDPTNQDRRYDRARIRTLLPELQREGLGAARLAETAERMRSAAEALDDLATGILREHVAVDELGVARGALAPVLAVHPEVGLRALARLLQAVGGASYTPRLGRLQGLYRHLQERSATSGKASRTLHDVLLTLERGRFAAQREWGRRGPPRMAIKGGQTAVWDGRFEVEAGDRRERDLAVAALALGAPPGVARGRAGLAALPALYAGERLVAVPPIGDLPSIAGVEALAARCLVAERLASPRAISSMETAEGGD